MVVLSRSRWRLIIATAFILLALILSLGFAIASRIPTHAAGQELTQISSDPYTNPDSQHKTQVEPDSFAFGNTIVSAFQSGRYFNGGASNIGFATSTNGGETWTSGFLPSSTVFATPPGIYPRASDPSVAYDAKHKVWMISWLGIKNPSVGPVDVLVSLSTDGGLTFGAPFIVNASGDFNDKNWTTCDNTPSSPHYGNCYTEFDDASLGDLEQMSTSSNGGTVWGAALPTADGSHGLGGQPLVQPNGNVIVPYMGLDSPFFAFTISSFMSTDGGTTWSASTLVSEGDFHHPNGGIRASFPIPDAEIDKSGKVYVVWSDCRFEASCAYSDIVLSTSTNGTTWTPVKRIPINPVGSNVDHFINGLAVDRSTPSKSAHIGLAYYYYPNANCTASTCKLDVGFISSTNGGSSWSKAVQVAGPMNLAWLPSTTQGVMVGDYISTSIVPGDDDATPVFALASPPTPPATTCAGSATACNEAIFTTSEDLLKMTGGTIVPDGVAVATSPQKPTVGGPVPTDF